MIAKRVLEILGDGKPHKGKDIAAMLSVNDRDIRQTIENLRRDGTFIVNFQDGNGYRLTMDINDIERQYWQDRNRALSILARTKHLRKYLKANGRRTK